MGRLVRKDGSDHVRHGGILHALGLNGTQPFRPDRASVNGRRYYPVGRTDICVDQIRSLVACMRDGTPISIGTCPSWESLEPQFTEARVPAHGAGIELSDIDCPDIWNRDAPPSNPKSCVIALARLFAVSDCPEPYSTSAQLIAAFGSLPQVLSGAVDRQKRACNGNDRAVAVLRQVNAVMSYTLGYEVSEKPVLANWSALIAHLHFDLAFRTHERFRVLHLNARNMLIRDDHMYDGSVDEAGICVREIVIRALDFGSVGIILVHNHPSGSLKPSTADIHATRRVCEACRPLGIVVHDHIIIAESGHVSLRAEGLL